MSQENKNNIADDTKERLSEDARGLGPTQAGPLAIGMVERNRRRRRRGSARVVTLA
jgi:hypothetical protein